jgi:Transposase DDE domain group 1
MGEKVRRPFQLSFNGLLKVDFQGSRITSDAGLILVRELDEHLGLGQLIDEHLSDSRQGLNKQFTLVDLVRQSVYSRLAGYEDLNDAERLSVDPTFRLIGTQKIWERGAALTSTRHGFETRVLASDENLIGLMAVNRDLVAQAEVSDDTGRVVLDMDSTESPVHGQQEGSAYNGHFGSVCYHPLLLFNSDGDCLAAKLRSGNVHSAQDWDALLLPEIERQQAGGTQVAFRADAAFAKPDIYEALEAREVRYAIRIPANPSLELEIEEILCRPPGRPGHKPLVRYRSFQYQAASWTRPRRIVAKVEHHQGELFPRVGFIVTNMSLPSRSVVRFYNKRGTAEQWIKEGKQATSWTRLSCHRFRANEVRLQLSVLAYNLGNLWRRLVLPRRIDRWSLTSVQQRLVKTGGRLVKHARYYWLLLAESHLTRRLFEAMLQRIWALPLPAG